MPQDETPVEAIYAEFLEQILPYAMGNPHPRFWGWVMGNGTVTGMLAEMLAAAMNPNVGGGDHSAIYVEQQVSCLDACDSSVSLPTPAGCW